MPQLEEALAIRRDLKDRSGQARILTDMGMIHLEQGGVGEAQRCFRESLSLFRKAKDDEGIVSILLGLGVLHRERERPDLAEATLRRAAAVARRTGQSLLRAGVLAELGEVLADGGRYETATATLEDALHLAEDTRSQKLLAKVLASRARLLARPGKDPSLLDKALKSAKRSVATARGARLAEGDMVNVFNALAAVFIARGKYNSALALTRKTMRMLPPGPPRTRLEKETNRLHEAARSRLAEDGPPPREEGTTRD
jgi:tetratricopeptide (TPR) repeat protein